MVNYKLISAGVIVSSGFFIYYALRPTIKNIHIHLHINKNNKAHRENAAQTDSNLEEIKTFQIIETQTDHIEIISPSEDDPPQGFVTINTVLGESSPIVAKKSWWSV